MAHEHHRDAKRTQRSKVQKVAGSTKHYQHPADKAEDWAYDEDQKLDPISLPTKQKVGP